MALLPKSKVWENTVRYGIDTYNEITEGTFNLIFALTTAFGMLVYGVLAALFIHAKLSIWEVLGIFCISLVGCFVATADFPLMKISGLSMIAGGLGAICGPYIGHFKVASVTEIAGATVFITLVLGAVGTLWPKSLQSWGLTLFVLLIALIVMQIFVPLLYVAMGLPLTGVLHLLDWVGILLFSGYIIYDFNRAQNLAKTVDNAMDCGVAVFLDIANLFIRLLDLFGVVKTGD
jgi:FtsH-binding integral membrane protein